MKTMPESEYAAVAVELDADQRRALEVLAQHGLMSVPQFAAVMWLADPDPSRGEALLDELRQAELVEPVLRSVGPVRFGLTPAGFDHARHGGSGA